MTMIERATEDHEGMVTASVRLEDGSTVTTRLPNGCGQECHTKEAERLSRLAARRAEATTRRDDLVHEDFKQTEQEQS